MIFLASRACLDLTSYGSEILHDGSNVLNSRLVKLKKHIRSKRQVGQQKYCYCYCSVELQKSLKMTAWVESSYFM